MLTAWNALISETPGGAKKLGGGGCKGSGLPQEGERSVRSVLFLAVRQAGYLPAAGDMNGSGLTALAYARLLRSHFLGGA